MYNHKLGKVSKKVFDTLHPDLQTIVSWGLMHCAVDMSLYEGHRPQKVQFSYYKKGRELKNGKWFIINKKAVITNVDGYKIKGKHNYNPSHAVDIRAYVPGKKQLTWDSIHLTYIGASLIMIADFLYNDGIIEHKLRWGGNWDKDGDLADNTLYDRPHVEIYKP
jgi:peptidoglycan L-alanyl-D-glutamate endopeptidase CwlK